MITLILAFLFTLSSLVLTIVSVLNEPWTEFGYGENKFVQGFMDCFDCPDGYRYGNYECVMVLACEGGREDLCEISKNLSKGKKIFFCFEGCSVLLTILLLKYLGFKCLNRQVSKPNIFLLIIWVLPLVKSIGITVFLTVSKVKFESADNNIKALVGVYLQLASMAACVISSTISIVFRLYKTQRHMQVENKISLGQFLTPIILLLISQVFLILSFIYPTARYSEYSYVDIWPGLGFNSEIAKQSLPLNCLRGQECAYNSDTCEMFSKLSDMLNIVLIINFLVYLVLIFWIDGLLYLIMNSSSSYHYQNLLFPALYSLLMLAGTIYYSASAHISYRNSCKITDFTSNWSLCPQKGFSFYILSTIFASLSSLLYIFIYTKSVKKLNSNSSFDLDNSNIKLKPGTIFPTENLKPQINRIVSPDTLTTSSLEILSANPLCKYCEQPLSKQSPDSPPYHYKCFTLNN